VASQLAPALFVAMDVIADPNFRRSVVLMLKHDEEDGALGLIVNRSTDYCMEQLCDNLELAWRGDDDTCVDWGGPVGEDTGWVLMGDEGAEGVQSEQLLPGLHWSRSKEALRRIAEAPSLRSRVFLGYAGWGPGQLEREIAEGSWLVAPADKRLVFDEPLESLWEQALRSLGINPGTLVSTRGVN